MKTFLLLVERFGVETVARNGGEHGEEPARSVGGGLARNVRSPTMTDPKSEPSTDEEPTDG